MRQIYIRSNNYKLDARLSGALNGSTEANEFMGMPREEKLWSSPEHARKYLARADALPRRTEGEATLLEFVPAGVKRVLDLGTGAGRLIGIMETVRPRAEFVGLDFSPTMFEAFDNRFLGDPRVSRVAHDFTKKLPAMGRFDCVISSFAIHHLAHERKRSLYAEVFELLAPGGIFYNLEHVASPTEALHDEFLQAIGMSREDEDAENILLDLETQLKWLCELGFKAVDCHWKWRELALFGGMKPGKES